MKNRGGLICRVRLAFVRNQKCQIGNLLPSGRDVIVDGIPQRLHGGPELRGVLHCEHFRGEVNYLLFGSRDGGHPARMLNKAKRTLYRIFCTSLMRSVSGFAATISDALLFRPEGE